MQPYWGVIFLNALKLFDSSPNKEWTRKNLGNPVQFGLRQGLLTLRADFLAFSATFSYTPLHEHLRTC